MWLLPLTDHCSLSVPSELSYLPHISAVFANLTSPSSPPPPLLTLLHLSSPPSLPPASPPCAHPFAAQFVYPSKCLALTSAILSTTHSIKNGSILHLPSPVSTPSPRLSLSRLMPPHFISSSPPLLKASTKQNSVWLWWNWVLSVFLLVYNFAPVNSFRHHIICCRQTYLRNSSVIELW